MDALTRWASALAVAIVIVFVFAGPAWILRVSAAGGVAVVVSFLILVLLRLAGKG